MRRLNGRIGILSILAFAVSGCAARSDVSPADVLRRSGIANREIASARFELTADVNLGAPGTEGMNGSLTIQGVLQNGGRQLSMNVLADGRSQVDWSVNADIVVAGPGETYVRLNEIAPSDLNFLGVGSGASALGVWWLLPSGDISAEHSDVAPDPRLLRLQTEAIDVTRDRGIVSHAGSRAHRYDVRLNPEKLATFLTEIDPTQSPEALLSALANLDVTGELFIDANDSRLRKATWVAQSADGKQTLLRMTLSIDDHDAGITVSPPGDARPLPVESLLPALPFTLPGA